MEKLGLGFFGDPSAPGMARLAKQAEAAGFESVWVAETQFRRDAITSATAIALGTATVRVGTAAINVFTRGAALTAVTMASLDDLVGGRAVLGIGTGSEHVLLAQGYRYDRPLARLREHVAAIRAVWHGADFRGEFVQVTGVELDFAPPRSAVPVYLAASGPRSLAFAGESADGVILDAFTPVAHTREAVAAIRPAAAAAGRAARQVEVAGILMVALDTPERTGRAALGPMVATYLTRFPTLAKASGLPDVLIEDYARLAALDGPGAVAARLADHVVDALTVSGSPATCRERIRAYRAAGLELPILVAAPDQIESVIAHLGPRSRPGGG